MDVTRVAEKLSTLEDEIHHLYEHVPFGSHALDAHGIYLHINSLELSWLGYSREEIVSDAGQPAVAAQISACAGSE